eukprot:1180990-Prorocentrum_minimum.AAC.1
MIGALGLGCRSPSKTLDDSDDEIDDDSKPASPRDNDLARKQRKMSLSESIKKKAHNLKGRAKKIITKPKEAEGPEGAAFLELVALLKEDPNNLWPLPPRLVIAGDVDATLFRFLTARKNSVPAAFVMLKDTILWRRENNVETALESSPSPETVDKIRRAISSAYTGFDYEGSPVYIERSGMLDVSKILSSGITQADLVQLHIVNMEYFTNTLCMEASIAKGETMDKVVSIMDVHGIGFRQFTNSDFLAMFKAMSAIDSNNYPEIMKAVYIVNAPGYFSSAFKLIKKFLDARTQKKIQVCKAKTLESVLDMNIVPKNVGGLGSDAVLSQPTGELSAAHIKQDREHERFVKAAASGDPIIGPNTFSIILGEGTPVYAERTKNDNDSSFRHHQDEMIGHDRMSMDSSDGGPFINGGSSSRKPSTEYGLGNWKELDPDLESELDPHSERADGRNGAGPAPPESKLKLDGNWKVYDGFDAQVYDGFDAQVLEALTTIDRALARVRHLQGSRRVSFQDGSDTPEVYTNGINNADHKTPETDRSHMRHPRTSGLFENPATIPELEELKLEASPVIKQKKRGIFACCFGGS